MGHCWVETLILLELADGWKPELADRRKMGLVVGWKVGLVGRRKMDLVVC